ncbi:hypothetical protein ACA910_011458 [Epithemia clementina (nom. ined.)]
MHLLLQLEEANRENKLIKERLCRAGDIITNSVRIIQQKEEKRQIILQANKDLQQQNATLKTENDRLMLQLYNANSEVRMATEKLSEKEKQVHNKNEQVLYHWKKCEDLKDKLDNAQFNLPKLAQTGWMCKRLYNQSKE